MVPATSTFGRRPDLPPGRYLAASARAARQAGTLIRKIGRQDSPAMSALMSRPVTTGARVVASMPSPPSIPVTAVRSSALYSSWTIDSTCGTIRAAAAPWASRAAISASGVGASPVSSEDTRNPATPATNSFL